MGRIQAAWTVVMDDEHNEIDLAGLDQFAAETLAEIDKRRWLTTKKPRVVQSQDQETALVVPTTLGLAMAEMGHKEPLAAGRPSGRDGSGLDTCLASQTRRGGLLAGHLSRCASCGKLKALDLRPGGPPQPWPRPAD